LNGGDQRGVSNLQTVNVFQRGFKSGSDAILVKLSPSDSALPYSTYVGGPGGILRYRVAVDGPGDA